MQWKPVAIFRGKTNKYVLFFPLFGGAKLGISQPMREKKVRRTILFHRCSVTFLFPVNVMRQSPSRLGWGFGRSDTRSQKTKKGAKTQFSNIPLILFFSRRLLVQINKWWNYLQLTLYIIEYKRETSCIGCVFGRVLESQTDEWSSACHKSSDSS